MCGLNNKKCKKINKLGTVIIYESLDAFFLSKFKLTSKVTKRTLEQTKDASLIRIKISIAIKYNISLIWHKVEL